VNLVADPDFASLAYLSSPPVWQCEPGAQASNVDGDGGSEFTQRTIGPRDGDGSAAEAPPVPSYELLGSPSGKSAAGCRQTVAVQPGMRYQLSMVSTGGPAYLGTEYGTVSTAGSAGWRVLTTAFTTGPAAWTVTVQVSGKVAGPSYEAHRLTLTGPASQVRAPIAPTFLHTEQQTSRTLWLRWVGSPGATNYRVSAGGVPVTTTSGTAALISLPQGQAVTLTVQAVNPAGASPVSAALTAGPVRVWGTVPAAPLRPTVREVPDGRIGVRVPEAPDRQTDGYYVYADGVRVGWTYTGSGFLVLDAGEHSIAVTALNAAGESPRSPAAVVGGSGS
jgi:hypothetical protein